MTVNQSDQNGDLKSYTAEYWKIEQFFIFCLNKTLKYLYNRLLGNWNLQKYRAKSRVQNVSVILKYCGHYNLNVFSS